MNAQPIETAPKDRRILILTRTKGFCFRQGRYLPTGSKWVEAVWREGWMGTPPGFQEWCGNSRTRTTSSLTPLAWAELPEGPHDD